MVFGFGANCFRALAFSGSKTLGEVCAVELKGFRGDAFP